MLDAEACLTNDIKKEMKEEIKQEMQSEFKNEIQHAIKEIKVDISKITQKEPEQKGDVLLNDLWSFYFHDPYDEDWTLPSYKKISDISSIHEFWHLQSRLYDKIQCGMFFLMREYIFPCWDDENNLKGGCFSLKVLKQDMPQFWQDLCIKILGETFLVNQEDNIHHWNLINGISTSPKKHFSIIRIWVKSSELNDPQKFNFPLMYQGDVFFKSNQQKIDENHSKLKSIHLD